MNNRNWNEYCGDKDLWDEYTHIEVSYEDKKLGSYAISSIRRDKGDTISVTTVSGNWYYCERSKSAPEILNSPSGHTLLLKNMI